MKANSDESEIRKLKNVDRIGTRYKISIERIVGSGKSLKGSIPIVVVVRELVIGTIKSK